MFQKMVLLSYIDEKITKKWNRIDNRIKLVLGT